MVIKAGTLLALAVAALSGCGGNEQPAGSGRLLITKALTGGPIFMEGSVTHVRVAGDRDATVFDGVRQPETLDLPLLDRRLPAGEYGLTTVERPCQGNCSLLDPPVEATRCELRVDVRRDRTTRVTIFLTAALGGVAAECSVTHPD